MIKFFKKITLKKIIGISIFGFVIFSYVNIFGPWDVYSADEYFIVRIHDLGDHPSKDVFRVYANNPTYKMYGITRGCRVNEIYERSSDEAKDALISVLRDHDRGGEEITIVETVSRKDL